MKYDARGVPTARRPRREGAIKSAGGNRRPSVPWPRKAPSFQHAFHRDDDALTRQYEIARGVRHVNFHSDVA